MILSKWKLWKRGKKRRDHQRKNRHLIPIIAAVIALIYTLTSKNDHLLLSLIFIGFVILIVVIVFYYAAKRKENSTDKEKKTEEKIAAKKKRHWGRWITWAIILTVIALAVASQLRKKLPAPTIYYNYNPSLICEDAWGHKIDFTNFTGDYFDVTPHDGYREGCWGCCVILPKAWSAGWRFHLMGSDPKDWNAFWFPGYQPAGPFRREDDAEFPCHPMRFWLQGKGTVRFYHL